MNSLVDENSPHLAPPGAGLPWVELQVSSLGFKWLSRLTNPEKTSAFLSAETAAILKLVVTCPPESGSTRVLIKRLPGMEDSSRYWSIYMTIDHLRIVNLAVQQTIRSLSRGTIPDRVVSTADVKPNPAASAEVISDFEATCQLLQKTVAQAKDLKTAVRYAHPWFGPLDAGQWYYLAPFHMRLHRRQLEKILEQLKVSSA